LGFWLGPKFGPQYGLRDWRRIRVLAYMQHPCNTSAAPITAGGACVA